VGVCTWRKMRRRSTTGTTPDSMMARSTEPGPTGGSWSASPGKGKMKLDVEEYADL